MRESHSTPYNAHLLGPKKSAADKDEFANEAAQHPWPRFWPVVRRRHFNRRETRSLDMSPAAQSTSGRPTKQHNIKCVAMRCDTRVGSWLASTACWWPLLDGLHYAYLTTERVLISHLFPSLVRTLRWSRPSHAVAAGGSTSVQSNL